MLDDGYDGPRTPQPARILVIGRGFSRRSSSTARLGLPEPISWTAVLTSLLAAFLHRSTIEKSLLDGGIMLWTFHEDPKPESEAADSGRIPFFIRCVGGDPPDVVHDVAHVLGTLGEAS